MTKMDAAASDSDSDRFDTDVTWMFANSSRLNSAMSRDWSGTSAAAGADSSAAAHPARNVREGSKGNVKRGIVRRHFLRDL
jgi:hypothetical protein